MKLTIKQLRVQLGWQGMSGIALLAVAGMFLMLALNPLEQETSFRHSRLDMARSKSAMEARMPGAGGQQKELDAFFNSLPAEQEITDILAAIAVAAEVSGVELKQAEYHLDNKNKPRVEYGLFFPVQGGYANIRHFVSRVLADHPAIALDQINMQRDRIDDYILKAEIRLTLFLRPGD